MVDRQKQVFRNIHILKDIVDIANEMPYYFEHYLS